MAIGYQFNDLHLQHQTASNGNGFHTSGYNVAFVRFFNDWFGLEAQTGFGFGKTGITTVPNNLVVKSFFVGGGPRFSFRNNSRLGALGARYRRAGAFPLYANCE